MSVSVRPRPDSPRQCPFCRDSTSEDVAPCACGVIYHPECRAELSKCVTIGCAGKSAAPGQRGAHRDVACVRCQGLISNDGDMCFGCWSPFHRRCLASGCCGHPRPEVSREETGSVFDHAGLIFGVCVLMAAVFSVMHLGIRSLLWLDRAMVIAGAIGVIVVGIGIEAVKSRRRDVRK